MCMLIEAFPIVIDQNSIDKHWELNQFRSVFRNNAFISDIYIHKFRRIKLQ